MVVQQNRFYIEKKLDPSTIITYLFYIYRFQTMKYNRFTSKSVKKNVTNNRKYPLHECCMLVLPEC